MIQVKHIKKIAIFVLLLITTFTLVACTKDNNVPMDGIKDTVYANLEGIKITEKDLYNNLRRQSINAVNDLIEDNLLKGFVAEARKLIATEKPEDDSYDKWAQEALDELVNQAIFSTTDVESIKKIKADNRNTLLEQFVDSLFLVNKTRNKNAIFNELTNLLADDTKEDFATNYRQVDVLVEVYINEIAKRLYADKVLKENMNDKKHDDFISDSQIISHYKSKETEKEDANVFYFHFLSSNEANAAFRQHNLKANSTGNWFRIPDIRDINDETVNGNIDYVVSVLESLNIDVKKLDKEDPTNPGFTTITDSEYKKYYENYSPSDSTSKLGKLENDEVLEAFVELYNTVNNNQIKVSNTPVNGAKFGIEYANGNEFDTIKTYDELNKLNSSLTSYIYNNLTTEKPYSTLRSVGSHRYLTFQLAPQGNLIDYVSTERDDDNLEKWVTIDELREVYENEEHEDKKYRDNLIAALKQMGVVNNDRTVQWDKVEKTIQDDIALFKERVIKDKLTSTFANNKFSEVINEGKIQIFDPIIRALWNQSEENKAKGSNKSGSIVFTFTPGKDHKDFAKFDINATDLFKVLEESLGVSATLDEMVNEALIKEWNKTDHGIFKDNAKDVDLKQFEKDYKALIKNFSSDQFASAGYPSSIGRENFLLLMFGSSDKKDVIEKGFLVPELREIFTSGFDLQLNSDYTIFDFLETYTQLQYNEFFGVNVSHLLVYYDENGDGNPDDPEEFLSKFENDAERLAHFELIEELFELIVQKAGKFDTLSTKLSTLVTEYQDSARIPLGFDDTEDWQKFRKAGINLKFENIPSEITNTSNFPTNSSTLDKVFYDRAIQLGMRIQAIVDKAIEDKDEIFEKGLPYFDMGGTTLNEGLDSAEINKGENVLDLLQNKQVVDGSEEYGGIQSSFGYHFILVDGLSDKISAKYEESKDRNEDYKFEVDGVEYNVYNTKDTISKSQIEYYVAGNKLEEGLVMPSDVRSAFSKYYAPVLDLFENQYSNSEIYFNYVSDVQFTLSTNNDVYKKLRAINKSQFTGYIVNNVNYDNLYGAWFTDIVKLYTVK